jgi:hypothetical protein
MTPDQGLRVSQALSSIAGWESCQASCDALITRDLRPSAWHIPAHQPIGGDGPNVFMLKECDTTLAKGTPRGFRRSESPRIDCPGGERTPGDDIDLTLSGQPFKDPTGISVVGQASSERIRSSLSEAAES